MKKNTKIVLGLAVLAGLFIAYKKGVFGGSTTESTDEYTDETTEPKTTAKEAAKDVSTTTATDVVQTAVTERPMPVIMQTSSETPQVVYSNNSGDSIVRTNNASVVTATNAPNPFFTTSF
jgi:hypothetical protein